MIEDVETILSKPSSYSKSLICSWLRHLCHAAIVHPDGSLNQIGQQPVLFVVVPQPLSERSGVYPIYARKVLDYDATAIFWISE